jgi:hypothetical protein
LEKAALIIIDEVAMAPAPIFSILDTVLRRIYDAHGAPHPMFAGKVVLFGGDMRQLGPIPNDGQTMSQLHFRNSMAFAEAKLLQLNINMRTAADEIDFANFLRQVGEGTTQQHVKLPVSSVILDHDLVLTNSKLESLIDWTFGDNPSISGAKSAILTPLNRDCTKINNMVIESMSGEMFVALSEDSVLDDTSTNQLLANKDSTQHDDQEEPPTDGPDADPDTPDIPSPQVLKRFALLLSYFVSNVTSFIAD